MKTETKTVTKKDLVDRIADQSAQKRVIVKRIIQTFLDEIITELGRGNRLEFRDFGVFELKDRKPRQAQNPKTMEKVHVPGKRTVKFKVGRLMKQKLAAATGAIIDDEAGDVADMAETDNDLDNETEETSTPQ